VRSEQNEAESWEWLGVNRIEQRSGVAIIEQRVGSGYRTEQRAGVARAESGEWLE
jgi:hypothetical protein